MVSNGSQLLTRHGIRIPRVPLLECDPRLMLSQFHLSNRVFPLATCLDQMRSRQASAEAAILKSKEGLERAQKDEEDINQVRKLRID